MISVIMPIFNTGPLLSRTLQCISEQTFNDYEIVCVDDGSDDSATQEIINKYVSFDNRFRLIELDEHLGAGEARNIGLQNARGDYVIFLDSDDLFSPDLLKQLNGAAVCDDLDVCICGFSRFDGVSKEKSIQSSKVPSGIFMLEDLDENGFFYCWLAAWNKLIRRTLLMENDIWFQNLSSSNDVYFTCCVLQAAKRIRYINKTGLITWITNRRNQICSNRDPRNLLSAVNAYLRRIPKDDILAVRKIINVLLINGLNEISSSNDNDKSIEFYDAVVRFFKENNSIRTCMTDAELILADCYSSFTIESEWWKDENRFYYQLYLNRHRIVKVIRHYRTIVLWGLGKRGMAMLRLCNEEKIRLDAIYDSEKDMDVFSGDYTCFANEDEVLKNADLIIATNSHIFNYICSINRTVVPRVVDLQLFCPAE